ncbi:hypothetical protein GUT183_02880 [Streptococcus ruminantium]|nr:hypothetical protein GUT183_02880 [Streptococcus ruminantium]
MAPKGQGSIFFENLTQTLSRDHFSDKEWVDFHRAYLLKLSGKRTERRKIGTPCIFRIVSRG